MRISTKGQVTVPLAIRERLGLVPGTEVEFEIDGNSAYLRRADGLSRGQALVARLTGSATIPMTTDEIMALTRGE
ncbi:MAG: AbrB/MazE/SpoVT family DNA-binding domain-containing protein [Gaiellaceae bacterium]